MASQAEASCPLQEEVAVDELGMQIFDVESDYAFLYRFHWISLEC